MKSYKYQPRYSLMAIISSKMTHSDVVLDRRTYR